MAVYRIGRDCDAVKVVAQAASEKVIDCKIEGADIYLETSQALTAAERSAILAAVGAVADGIFEEPL